MTITVIGHLCHDVIELPDGSEAQSYGGIYFAVATLANLLGKNDRIVPVFGVGEEEYGDFMSRVAGYPTVDTSGIFKLNGPTNRVRLCYSSAEKRIECSKEISEPIPWKKIKPFIDADMALLNMISGSDITLETLDEIRMESREHKIPVYLDVHCLPCGVNSDSTRYYRPLNTWRRWLFMLHAAQMNELEAASLTPDHLDEPMLAKHVHALDTGVLHITRGDRGSTVFIDEHKTTKRFDVPVTKQEKVMDTTGCGDVFGAAYCAHYLKSLDVVASTNYANTVAAFKARLPGSREIEKLSQFRVNDL